jgi:hypothetical protein
MKRSRAVWPMAVLASALAAGGCVSPAKTSGRTDTAQAASDRLALADAAVGQWANTSSLAARLLIDKYGPPDEIHYGRLVWNHNGPWKRTIARDVRPTFVEGDDLGSVEQTVDYALTPGQENALASYTGHAFYDPHTGELSAHSDKEELNFLSMNVLDDVVRGRMDALQARDAYARVVSLEASGKSSPYLTGLRFTAGR